MLARLDPRAATLTPPGPTGALAHPTTMAVTEAAFDRYIDGHKARLFSLAYGILRDHGEAEDAVQETMWKAWTKWDTVREEDKRDGWLTRICINHCLRSKQRLGRATVADVADRPGRAPAPRDPDLDRAFAVLPPKQRAAVLLHYHWGCTVEQTAELMGCRPGTVRTHVQRALATLRRELSDD